MTVVDRGAGPTVVVVAGTPNSRTIRPADALVDELGVRCISLDRPGYGGSDPVRFDGWFDSGKWLAEVLSVLDVDQFSLVGWSAGAGHSWHLASLLGDRCLGLTIVGGLCSVDDPRLFASLPSESASRIRALRRAPIRVRRKMIEWALRPTAERAAGDPRVRVDELMQRVGDSDHELMAAYDVMAILDLDVAEAFVQGVDGWATDALLMTRAWAQVRPKCPISVLHGDDDREVGRDSGHAIADAAAVDLEVVDGGHYWLLSNWTDLLT